MMLYLVRQYRPAFFSGFEDEVYCGVPFDQITSVVPFMKNFRHGGFDWFKIEPYWRDELIVTAHYKDSTSWVAAFATREDSPLASDWRYANAKKWLRPQESNLQSDA